MNDAGFVVQNFGGKGVDLNYFISSALKPRSQATLPLLASPLFLIIS